MKLRNPKYILYWCIFISFTISVFIAWLPYKFEYEVNYIGLNLHLTFVAVIFFVYSLFMQSKLGENSFFHMWELVQDRFLILCFAYYFLSLLLNVSLSIINFNIEGLSSLSISIYVFMNIFALCLVFCLFIFIMQLTNPVKHSYYLISKITTKRILKYNLGSIKKLEKGIRLERKLFSPIIKEEDPLMAIHELIVPSIIKFDYRSIGLILEKLLQKSENRQFSFTKKEHIRYAFHILSYTTRLVKNLNKKHEWNDLGFLRYFSHIYLESIKKAFDNNNIYIGIMYEISLMNILEYYYENQLDKMKILDFSPHIKLITSINNFEDNKQLTCLHKIFSKKIKNPALHIRKNIHIDGFIHPWE